MPAAVAVVIVTLVATTIEPPAFGNDSGENAKPVVLPNRPMFVTIPEPQVPRRTVARAMPAKTPAAQQSKSSSKKWIWIAVAAAAAGTAAILARGNSSKATEAPAPTITIGTPTVGQQQ
jgi:hypothetical protein